MGQPDEQSREKETAEQSERDGEIEGLFEAQSWDGHGWEWKIRSFSSSDGDDPSCGPVRTILPSFGSRSGRADDVLCITTLYEELMIFRARPSSFQSEKPAKPERGVFRDDHPFHGMAEFRCYDAAGEKAIFIQIRTDWADEDFEARLVAFLNARASGPRLHEP